MSLRDSDTDDPESTPTRRSVLGAVGATMATAAVSGVGSARGDLQAKRARALSLKAGYQSREDVAAALDEHASDVLSDLADRGLLDAREAGALALAEPTTSVEEYRTAIEGGDAALHVGGMEATDGTVTAHISASVWTDEGRLSIHVQPEVGEAHAALRDGDGSGGTVFRSTDGSVEPQKFCEYSCTDCSVESCGSPGYYQAYEEYCCTYSDGSTSCDPTGDPCSSCC